MSIRLILVKRVSRPCRLEIFTVLFCATEKLKETSAFVNVTIGAASLKKHRPSEPFDLIAFADKALYVGKENGRNQVVVL